ncbi:glycine cleavage system protein GcvH [Francisellaceae bacterium CB299]|jgi:glycine cleavage system H protein
MADIKENLLYTPTNEWIKIDGDIAIVGIDDYSQNEFGEIVFVDFPKVGSNFSKDDEVCVIESVKTASDICAPLSGEIIKINDSLIDSPKLLNESCYDKGWLFEIKLSDKRELDKLMKADAYKDYLSQ